MEKLQVPVYTKISHDDGKTWEKKLQLGPIGGFTFPSGEKALIYQCDVDNCGKLCKFNTGFNKHRREQHGLENCAFGWADGAPKWQELDITPEMITELPE